MGVSHAKRGARGAKAGHNPVNNRPPEEFIALVGGASNAWSGFVYDDGNAYVPMPHPKNLAGVGTYIKGNKGQPALTHDMYWANFIDPAVRLYANRVAKPKGGDIITLLVYIPAYESRNEVDWEASPYNQQLHRYSPWVKGDSEYDPSVVQNQTSPSAKKPSAIDPVSAIIGAAAAKAAVHSEAELDHDIMMRQTSRNDPSRRIIKRPNSPHAYLDYIHDIPRVIVYGPGLAGHARLENVLVKLLLFTEPAQVVQYMTRGEFDGEYWKHVLDTHDEEDMADTIAPKGARWDAAMVISRRWEGWWKRWMKRGAEPPSVDRKKIKIRRFDYFGHSAADVMFLQYGWHTVDAKTHKMRRQAKGETPESDVYLAMTATGPDANYEIADLVSPLKREYFSGDAFAQLWGCFLGAEMAPKLLPMFREVVACEDRTNFEHILDNDTNMPVPTENVDWTRFKSK